MSCQLRFETLCGYVNEASELSLEGLTFQSRAIALSTHTFHCGQFYHFNSYLNVFCKLLPHVFVEVCIVVSLTHNC